MQFCIGSDFGVTGEDVRVGNCKYLLNQQTLIRFGVNVTEWKSYIEAKAWSDKNLTKCTAVVRGDEAYP